MADKAALPNDIGGDCRICGSKVKVSRGCVPYKHPTGKNTFYSNVILCNVIIRKCTGSCGILGPVIPRQDELIGKLVQAINIREKKRPNGAITLMILDRKPDTDQIWWFMNPR